MPRVSTATTLPDESTMGLIDDPLGNELVLEEDSQVTVVGLEVTELQLERSTWCLSWPGSWYLMNPDGSLWRLPGRCSVRHDAQPQG